MGQLTVIERYQIHTLLKTGKNTTEIGLFLGRHRTTIWREINPNRGLKGYRPKQANEISLKRRESSRRSKMKGGLKNIIDKRLYQQHSPEQISGYLKYEKGIHISHECIYQYVLQDKQAGGSLYKNLRQSHRKRKKRFGAPNRKGLIPNRKFIGERPNVVNERLRFGDWEGDTIIGKSHKGSLVSLVERKSKYVLIKKVKRKTKEEVTNAIIKLLGNFKNKAKTLTVDNGKEFAGHEIIEEKTSLKVFFSNPYSSRERGSNENTNGLIRQYFPKKFDLRNFLIAGFKKLKNSLITNQEKN